MEPYLLYNRYYREQKRKPFFHISFLRLLFTDLEIENNSMNYRYVNVLKFRYPEKRLVENVTRRIISSSNRFIANMKRKRNTR